MTIARKFQIDVGRFLPMQLYYMIICLSFIVVPIVTVIADLKLSSRLLADYVCSKAFKSLG